MDVGNSKTGIPHQPQEIGNKSAETNRTMTTRSKMKRTAGKIDTTPKKKYAQKSTIKLNNKSNTKERKEQKYFTGNSVEEIVDKGKVCVRTNTESTDIGKYFTVTGVEELLEDGKEPSSTTLINNNSDKSLSIVVFDSVEKKERKRSESSSMELAGITHLIENKLGEIGLKHQRVSPGGNCVYLAISLAQYGTTSKWQKIRKDGAKYLAENRKNYTETATEEIVAETIKDMTNPGGNSDELAITVLQDMLKRPVEIWMRSKSGEDIENHPHYPVKRDSILLWYNGINNEGVMATTMTHW